MQQGDTVYIKKDCFAYSIYPDMRDEPLYIIREVFPSVRTRIRYFRAGFKDETGIGDTEIFFETELITC